MMFLKVHCLNQPREHPACPYWPASPIPSTGPYSPCSGEARTGGVKTKGIWSFFANHGYLLYYFLKKVRFLTRSVGYMPNKRFETLLLPPSPEMVRHYVNLFDQDKRVRDVDDTIRTIVRVYPENSVLSDVLIKTCLINDLYGTNVYGTYSMARHIYELNIDDDLTGCSKVRLSLVSKIAHCKFKENIRVCYSFATKYCNWHDPISFPIYDGIVDNVLWAYRKQGCLSRYKANDVQDYTFFKGVIDQLISCFNLSEFNYKQIDKFLWMYGRNVSEDENQGSSAAI